MNYCIPKITFLVICTVCQRLSVVTLHMLSGLGLRTVTCDGNPQLPNACGPIISPAPLFACLTHGIVGVLVSSCSGQVLWERWALRSLYLPYLAVWFQNHTSGCSCFGIWSCGSNWNQELGAASAKAFVFSISPLATYSKLWSCPGCGMEEEEGALVRNCF